KPYVHAVHRVADEVVARHDRAVGPQPCAARGADAAQGAAVAGRLPFTRSIEIDTAQLQAAHQLPDAVEHQTMALVRHCETVLSAEVGGDGEADLRDAAERRRIAVAQRRQRV